MTINSDNIGSSAFSGCTGLLSASINSRNIGIAAFSGCNKLADVVMATSVETIGNSSFSGCSSITEIEIPNNVTNIGQSAFAACTELEYISIGRGVINIPANAFDSCGLKSLTIPNSVESIGTSAFRNCSSLKKVIIPSSVTSINQSFTGSTNIEEADIPQIVLSKPVYDTFPTTYSSVTMGSSVALKAIKLNTDVKRIHDNAFALCRNITSITTTSTNFYMVAQEDGILYNKDKTELVLCPKDKTNVVIPASVRKIWNYAFAYCSSLKSVTIPDSVVNIGEYAFADCADLEGVIIPSSVETLSTTAFDGCQKTWTAWYRSLSNLAANGSAIGDNAEMTDTRYTLAGNPADRAIADVTVSEDTALDAFVLKEGKVYDSVLYVKNNASHAVRVSLPSGNTYQTFKGAAPLTLPANSTSILTITRVARGISSGNVFLVTREELETMR